MSKADLPSSGYASCTFVSLVVDDFGLLPQPDSIPMRSRNESQTSREPTRPFVLMFNCLLLPLRLYSVWRKEYALWACLPNRPSGAASGRIRLSRLRIKQHFYSRLKTLSTQIISLASPRISVVQFPPVVTHAIPLRSTRDPRTKMGS